ncbi:hypothetical protein B0H67DRAFT_675727 [Lasiosphaeris hirsuta]|uniref:Uncharacterized protein n=1 Tax=Lasiosphaeris hirsuta TaxID=260670 RepID=A0AA39ZY22_9PEZI|nr:hypothetical protein B0H67DRAFT_675727 [Lasiosphaeris hirsuta]
MRRLQLWPLLVISSIAFNIFFVSLGLFALTHPFAATDLKGSYERGFASDLEPSRSQIGLVVKPFSGGVELDSQGHFFTDRGGQEYVGPPEPAIDEAWEALLGGWYSPLREECHEVDLADSTFRWPESGFSLSGLDVYHSLHCLNRLRQALHPTYYAKVFSSPTDPSLANHIDHCINHIRQSLQCHADLTPMEWRLVGGSRLILKTDTLHTCRDFDRIHAWATSKGTRFEAIPSYLNGSLVIID